MDQVQPHLSDEDLSGLADVVEVCRAQFERLLEHQREVGMRAAPDLAPNDGELRARAEEGLAALDTAVRTGDLATYLAGMRHRSSELAGSGLPFRTIGRGIVDLVRPLSAMVDEALGDDPARAARAHRALHDLEMEYLVVAGEAFATAREDTVESAYTATIRRLSTPVVEVWDEVLVMPLVGVVDSGRAQQMMEQVLDRIVERHARIVILDITGVPTVDTAVAEHLIRTTRAGRLVGARTVLVGIGPQVAQTLVRLGVSLGDVETFVDLRSGLESALAALGYVITRGDR